MGRRAVTVTIAGARTGLVGGCVPNQGALVSLENFDRVLALYRDEPSAEWRLRAQCAVTLRTIAAQLAVKRFPDIEACADGRHAAGARPFPAGAGRLRLPAGPDRDERLAGRHGRHERLRGAHLPLRADPRLGARASA